MSKVFRLPPLPVFDYESVANPFAWIVRHAPQARAARSAAQTSQRASLVSRLSLVCTPNPHAKTQEATGRQKDGHQAGG